MHGEGQLDDLDVGHGQTFQIQGVELSSMAITQRCLVPLPDLGFEWLPLVLARRKQCIRPAVQQCRTFRVIQLGCATCPLADDQVAQHLRGHQGGVGDRGQLGEPYPVGSLREERRPTSVARRVFPTPPGPASVTNQFPSTSLITSATSVSRPRSSMRTC